MKAPRDVARRVLGIEAAAIEGVIAQLDEAFDRAVERILAARGRVVCSGMGKSGIVMQKIAAEVRSGTPGVPVRSIVGLTKHWR